MRKRCEERLCPSLVLTSRAALVSANRKSRLRVAHRILVLRLRLQSRMRGGAGPAEDVGPGPGVAGGDPGDNRFHEAL